jgi:hypothetical protein
MILSENDKWLVLSPGRTGSKIIIDCLYSSYREANLPIEYLTPRKEITEIPALAIGHSHSIDSLHHIDTNVRVVLSTRDMVESALSWCIYPKIGNFHLYPAHHQVKIDELQESIPAFHLTKEDLYRSYRHIKAFYDMLAIMPTQFTAIIDYEDIKNDPAKVYDILGITKPARYKQMAIKNPGTHEQWITNWDEISEFIAKLERTPFKDFQRQDEV